MRKKIGLFYCGSKKKCFCDEKYEEKNVSANFFKGEEEEEKQTIRWT